MANWRRICSWCGKDLDDLKKDPKDVIIEHDDVVSHGMCRPCAEELDIPEEDIAEAEAQMEKLSKRDMDADDSLKPVSLMKLTQIEDPDELLKDFDRSEILIEEKLDGWKAQIIKSNGEVKIYSRKGEDKTENFPELIKALASLPDNTALEGELVYWDGNKQDISKVTSLAGSNPENAADKKKELPGKVKLHFYDVIVYNGKLIADKSFEERRKVLENIIKPSELIQITKQYPFDKWQDAMNIAVEKGGEGIVLKIKSKPYQYKSFGENEPKPAGTMYKYKGGAGKSETDDYVVYDFEMSDKGNLKALFGQYYKGNLYHISEISNFSKEDEEEVKSKLKDGEFVVELGFQERLPGGLRHQKFIRFRDDKKPKDSKMNEFHVKNIDNFEIIKKASIDHITITAAYFDQMIKTLTELSDVPTDAPSGAAGKGDSSYSKIVPIPGVDTKKAYDIFSTLESSKRFVVGDSGTSFGKTQVQIGTFLNQLAKDPETQRLTGMSPEQLRSFSSEWEKCQKSLSGYEWREKVSVNEAEVKRYAVANRGQVKKRREGVIIRMFPGGQPGVVRIVNGSMFGEILDLGALRNLGLNTSSSSVMEKIKKIMQEFVTWAVVRNSLARVLAYQRMPEIHDKIMSTFSYKNVNNNPQLLALTDGVSQSNLMSKIKEVSQAVSQYGYNTNAPGAYNIYQLIAISNAGGVGRVVQFLKNKKPFESGYLTYLDRANKQIQKVTGIATNFPSNQGLSGFRYASMDSLISKRASYSEESCLYFPSQYADDIKEGKRRITIRASDVPVEVAEIARCMTYSGSHICDVRINAKNRMSIGRIEKAYGKRMARSLEQQFGPKGQFVVIRFEPWVENKADDSEEKWKEVLIDKYDVKLTREEIKKHYMKPSIRKKIMARIKDKPVLIYIGIERNENVLKRNHKGEPIVITNDDPDKSNKPNNYFYWVDRRLLSIHEVFGNETNLGFVDLDLHGDYSLAEAKKYANEVSKKIKEKYNSTPVIYSSGGSGLHIEFDLEKKVSINTLRSELKNILDELNKDHENVTTSTVKGSGMRSDVSTLHNKGSLRVPGSLGETYGKEKKEIAESNACEEFGVLHSGDEFNDSDPMRGTAKGMDFTDSFGHYFNADDIMLEKSASKRLDAIWKIAELIKTAEVDVERVKEDLEKPKYDPETEKWLREFNAKEKKRQLEESLLEQKKNEEEERNAAIEKSDVVRPNIFEDVVGDFPSTVKKTTDDDPIETYRDLSYSGRGRRTDKKPLSSREVSSDPPPISISELKPKETTKDEADRINAKYKYYLDHPELKRPQQMINDLAALAERNKKEEEIAIAPEISEESKEVVEPLSEKQQEQLKALEKKQEEETPALSIRDLPEPEVLESDKDVEEDDLEVMSPVEMCELSGNWVVPCDEVLELKKYFDPTYEPSQIQEFSENASNPAKELNVFDPVSTPTDSQFVDSSSDSDDIKRVNQNLLDFLNEGILPLGKQVEDFNIGTIIQPPLSKSPNQNRDGYEISDKWPGRKDVGNIKMSKKARSYFIPENLVDGQSIRRLFQEELGAWDALKENPKILQNLILPSLILRLGKEWFDRNKMKKQLEGAPFSMWGATPDETSNFRSNMGKLKYEDTPLGKKYISKINELVTKYANSYFSLIGAHSEIQNKLPIDAFIYDYLTKDMRRYIATYHGYKEKKMVVCSICRKERFEADSGTEMKKIKETEEEKALRKEREEEKIRMETEEEKMLRKDQKEDKRKDLATHGRMTKIEGQIVTWECENCKHKAEESKHNLKYLGNMLQKTKEEIERMSSDFLTESQEEELNAKKLLLPIIEQKRIELERNQKTYDSQFRVPRTHTWCPQEDCPGQRVPLTSIDWNNEFWNDPKSASVISNLISKYALYVPEEIKNKFVSQNAEEEKEGEEALFVGKHTPPEWLKDVPFICPHDNVSFTLKSALNKGFEGRGGYLWDPWQRSIWQIEDAALGTSFEDMKLSKEEDEKQSEIVSLFHQVSGIAQQIISNEYWKNMSDFIVSSAKYKTLDTALRNRNLSGKFRRLALYDSLLSLAKNDNDSYINWLMGTEVEKTNAVKNNTVVTKKKIKQRDKTKTKETQQMQPVLRQWVDYMLQRGETPKDGIERYGLESWFVNEREQGIKSKWSDGSFGTYFIVKAKDGVFDCELQAKKVSKTTGNELKKMKILKILGVWKLDATQLDIFSANELAGVIDVKNSKTIEAAKTLAQEKTDDKLTKQKDNLIPQVNYGFYSGTFSENAQVSDGDYLLVNALMIPGQKHHPALLTISTSRQIGEDSTIFQELKSGINDVEMSRAINKAFEKNKKITELSPEDQFKFIEQEVLKIRKDMAEERQMEKTSFLSIRAADPLGAYKKKRDFDGTSEPEGNVSKENKHRFVIQKHDATNLHFDLRLENDKGVLQSWAVPKHKLPEGKEKLLAVETEPHPIEYAKFEGDIEEGYGEGHVDIWASGKYEPIEVKKDKIIFEIKSGNAKGKFVLFRTDGKRWMLMRKKED